MSAAWPFGDLRPFSFDLVELDPAWRYKLWSAKGEAKSPQAHYPTMSLEEVKALRVGDLVAPEGVVILWCTWPLVAIGAHVEVLNAWGMQPVTGGGWSKRTVNGKSQWGTGYVARSLHEPYIIARLKGAKWIGASFPNLVETLEAEAIDGLAREHSRKPDEFYALVEKAWPEARRASLFSRQRRKGWEVWGNEVDKFGVNP
jgi:N6-adenosine-specific RNA methylase IME4